MARPVRRVITGHNEQGRSILLKDGPAPNTLEMDSMPGLVVTDLWETRDAPADNRGEADNADRPIQLEPPKNGTICRIVDFPPDRVYKDSADAKAGFDSIGAGHTVDSRSADPMMHTTATTDYAIVLEGEVWAVMDDEETCLRAGDVLIQRGTNHSWSVRGDEPARVCFVLVSAAPLS